MIRKGTYVLFFTLRESEIRVGSLGTLSFPAGRYCYAGSAMGGLDQRIGRHLSKEKTMRWHIDYLTSVCEDAEAYESYPDPIQECALAHLAESCGAVPCTKGFGCSDCRCVTHLFTVDAESEASIITSAGLRKHYTSQ